MGILAKIIKPIVEALATVLKRFVQELRREKQLIDKGKNEVVSEYYKDVAKKQENMLDVNRPADGDERRRLHDGSF